MTMVDQITEKVIKNIREDVEKINKNSADKDIRDVGNKKRSLTNIKNQNTKIAQQAKSVQNQVPTDPKPNVNLAVKPFKGIKESKKIELIKKINEIKKTIQTLTESIPKSVIEEAKFKNFMKKLNEYIDVEEDYDEELGYGDFSSLSDTSNVEGDALLDKEISKIEVPGAKSFIDQIRKQSLEAMASLADKSQSPEFQTMNNIFSQCQKYANDLNKAEKGVTNV
jgi:hypothetical protein